MIEKYTKILAECKLDIHRFLKTRGLSYKELMREVRVNLHPDVSPNREECEHLILEFSNLEQELDSKKIGDYRIVRKLATGDLSEVFVVEKSDIYYVAKKPMIKHKSITNKEFKILIDIRKHFKPNDLFIRALPEPVEIVDDSSIFKVGDGKVDFLEDYISGADVINKHKNLDSRHIIWMAKRALTIIDRVHCFGYVNGAITPKHLLFKKSDHGILCLGWLHSGKIGSAVTVVPKDYVHYYPTETKSTKTLSKDLDVYMLSKSMLDIAGPNCHPRIKAFFESCIKFPVKMRPDDARILHGELVDTAKSVFGKPFFVTLE